MIPRVTVDLGSGVPPYEQIRSQVAALVSAGHLPPGSRLPTVRDLAADLGVAPGTVQRAYRELESTGVVESRRRTGTVVGTTAAAPVSPALREEAARLVRAGRADGLSDADILTLVHGALLTQDARTAPSLHRMTPPAARPEGLEPPTF